MTFKQQRGLCCVQEKKEDLDGFFKKKKQPETFVCDSHINYIKQFSLLILHIVWLL